MKSPYGGAETIEGNDEVLQRILMRLKARRGAFLPLPDYGSRLHELRAMKRSERALGAKQFVYEALEKEKDVSVLSVEYSDAEDGRGIITARLGLSGGDVMLTVNI